VISLGSLVGFLTVLGIVARNGIMLISHVQHLERGEGVPFGPELVMRGAIERLVPIMMTVLTTGLTLIPLLVSGSIPGQEIEHPMAVVISAAWSHVAQPVRGPGAVPADRQTQKGADAAPGAEAAPQTP
jgi:multidrug efflux pump subunit AcrB